MKTQVRRAFLFALVVTVGGIGTLHAQFITNGDVAGLIAAINAANATSRADTIDLARGGTYTLNGPPNTSCDGPSGLLAITTEININGHGATIERATGAPEFRIFCVAGVGNLTLHDLTVTRGDAPIYGGGGIALESVNTTVLTLNNTLVSNNNAKGGGGIQNGKLNVGGVVTLFDSRILDNTTTTTQPGGAGAGLNNHGRMLLFNSTVGNNETMGIGGGGLWNSTGSVTVVRSTFRDNRALGSDPYPTSGRGGGIFSSGGDVVLRNSTITGNSAKSAGGGIQNEGINGTMDLTHCTVFGNSADNGGGGGIQHDSASGSSFTLRNTIVAESSFVNTGPAQNAVGDFHVLGENIVEMPHNGSFSGGPMLFPPIGGARVDPFLQNYGGITDHHRPRGGSPAMNMILDYCPEFDQRRMLRPQPQAGQQALCDLGAHER